jgi:hypothetical protein
MKLYAKPVVEAIDDIAEVVCADGSNDAANGGNSNVAAATPCRFGRVEASAGSDTCQSCCKTNGVRGSEQAYRADFTSCIEDKPLKES